MEIEIRICLFSRATKFIEKKVL